VKNLVFAGRLVFGAWMLVNGANHFFLSFWPEPVGHEPLAAQLMAALVHSRLFDVAMVIQLLTGALILTGIFVPVALCVVMPISTCALYWSLVLDHQVLGTVLALIAFALNGLLMLAYIDYYKGALQKRALAAGEDAQGSFDVLFASPNGRTSREQFVPALITLVAVVVFYALLVKGRSGLWSMLALLIPGVILHMRRLRDMGRSGWVLVVPAGLMVVAFAIWLQFLDFGPQVDLGLTWAAMAVAVGFGIWGSFGVKISQ
jgi:uncharacterized membrane protein YhaH (DUF805 family)